MRAGAHRRDRCQGATVTDQDTEDEAEPVEDHRGLLHSLERTDRTSLVLLVPRMWRGWLTAVTSLRAPKKK